MQRLFGIVLVLGYLTSPIRAQDAGSPEAMRAANELMQIMSADMMKQMTSAMTAQMWPQLQNQFGGKVDSATLLELRSEYERVLTKFLSESMTDAPSLYARYFSAQELHDIAAFYRTPTGAKSLQLVPKVMAEFTNSLMPRLPAFQRELEGAVEYVVRKHGYKN